MLLRGPKSPWFSCLQYASRLALLQPRTGWRRNSSAQSSVFFGPRSVGQSHPSLFAPKGTFPAVQRLGLRASIAGDAGLICDWGTKIPHAMQCHQKKKKSWSFGEKSTKLILLRKNQAINYFLKKNIYFCVVCVCVHACVRACMHRGRQSSLTSFSFKITEGVRGKV